MNIFTNLKVYIIANTLSPRLQFFFIFIFFGFAFSTCTARFRHFVCRVKRKMTSDICNSRTNTKSIFFNIFLCTFFTDHHQPWYLLTVVTDRFQCNMRIADICNIITRNNHFSYKTFNILCKFRIFIFIFKFIFHIFKSIFICFFNIVGNLAHCINCFYIIRFMLNLFPDS